MKKPILFLWVILTALNLPAQSIPDKMHALLTAYNSQQKFTGSVLVTQKGKVLFERAYGVRNVVTQTPHAVNDIFQIGSITKQFTAAIIMQLQEEGKLSVSDQLSKYFPDFPNSEYITIEHLLTHTSGLFNYTSDPTFFRNDFTKPRTKKELLTLFSQYKPDFAPGTNYAYSNTGYHLLGYIIEEVTGRPYETVVRERILHPLNMNQSGFDFFHLAAPQKSTGYLTLYKETGFESPVLDSTIAYSAGALYSSVTDLAKWESAISKQKLLKPTSWQKIFSPHKNKYGYGWVIDSLHGQKAYMHSGSIPGFASYLLRIPAKEMAFILIDNASSAEVGKIGNALASIALDKPYHLPQPPKTIILNSEELKEYTGEYTLAPGFSIKVFLEGIELKAQATGQDAFTLYAKEKDKFFLKVVDAELEFLRDGGSVSGIVLYQNGGELKGKKQ